MGKAVGHAAPLTAPQGPCSGVSGWVGLFCIDAVCGLSPSQGRTGPCARPCAEAKGVLASQMYQFCSELCFFPARAERRALA